MKRAILAPYAHHLETGSTLRWTGRVNQIVGNLVESDGPFCFVGESCEIKDSAGRSYSGEIIGFRGSTMLSMTADPLRGIRFGDRIVTRGARPSVRVGPGMLGRVVDTAGNPMDGKGEYRAAHAMLIAADMTVLALVGERGREVGEFLEVLGEEGLQRAVVVVSTSDQSPLLRLRAALAATAIAEYFASLGRNVLLIVDSLTRFAMAQREIGLAAGEPPTAKGYTPSVLNTLARLVERAGNFSEGSITAFYTVLMEGDDQQDPVVDTVRSLLDGHVVLDRNLAMRSHYPPISILDSLSRLMPSVVDKAHLAKAKALRLLVAAYTRSEDLIRIGAYQKGSDAVLDSALEILPALNAFLQQTPNVFCSLQEAVEQLMTIPA